MPILNADIRAFDSCAESPSYTIRISQLMHAYVFHSYQKSGNAAPN